MHDELSFIFGSQLRVKVMRFFIFSPETPFTINDIKQKTGGSITAIRKEVNVLVRANFLKKRQFYKIFTKKVRGNTVDSKKKVSGFILNDNFSYLHQFRNLLIDAVPFRGDNIARRFNKAGKIKLLITSGIFIQEPESRLDIMIVGDRLNRSTVEKTIKNLESEIGKELRYAVFDTPDYKYRVSVYDRLVRDVLDYPHQKILDRLTSED